MQSYWKNNKIKNCERVHLLYNYNSERARLLQKTINTVNHTKEAMLNIG